MTATCRSRGRSPASRHAALASGAISLIILAFNIVNPSAFTIIISLGIILMYLAYLGVTTQLLRKRQAGWPDNLPDRRDDLFSLGRWARITNVVAILYGAAMIVNLVWPRPLFYGTLWYQKWGPLLVPIAIIIVGILVYEGGIKNRVGVRDEHRAQASAGD